MRLIDADALKYDFGEINDGSHKWWDLYVTNEAIAKQPTIDAEHVLHGKWIPHEDEDGEHYGDKCSECGEWYVMPYGKTNFCPHCGARMDSE